MTNAQFDEWLINDQRRPLIMGVLNVTPDSFSDGSRFFDPRTAADHARRMADAGADLIDIGGESTRPGSDRVDSTEQIRRILPVFDAENRIFQVCRPLLWFLRWQKYFSSYLKHLPLQEN